MVIASSISGLPIYAPSAAFAPTNSGEVSAIASAYQVVSATATQLYAGTSYVTSINDAPISASRAGNAANASLASSAWYDGTGRLISSLPDSATVSAIASAYAESAASGKQDTLTFGYDTADKISSIDGSALAGEGGLVSAIGSSTSGITSINNSGLVDTAALHSSDYSSLYVQEPLYISASGDSSYIGISGNVGGVDSATCSAIASAYAESAVSAASSNYYTTANESGYLTAQAQASWSESASASPSYIVDKPDLVDIVAGPGIHIDNPDGNTLRVSMAQDYEVTLWSGTGTSGSTINLSETVKNFDRVRFYGHENNRGRGCLYEINPRISYDANTLQFAIATTDAAYAGATWFVGQYLTYLTYTDTAATAMTVNGGEQWFSFNNTSAIQHNTARYVIIDKIVGINRTASAQ